MVWTVFCHAVMVQNVGDIVGGQGNQEDTLERLVFDLADADSSGEIDFEELVSWVDVLMNLNLVPESDRVDMQGMRASTAEEIARKYMARFDVNDDRVLSRTEFVELSQALRLKGALASAVSLKRSDGSAGERE